MCCHLLCMMRRPWRDGAACPDAGVSRRFTGPGEIKCAAVARSRFDPDASAMAIDDGTHGCESDAFAVGAVGHQTGEEAEDFFLILGGYTRSGIAHREAIAITSGAAGDIDPLLDAVSHVLDGVI